MFLIVTLMLAIISGCITAGHYENGKPVTTGVFALITAILFTVYMTGIQS